MDISGSRKKLTSLFSFFCGETGLTQAYIILSLTQLKNSKHLSLYLLYLLPNQPSTKSNHHHLSPFFLSLWMYVKMMGLWREFHLFLCCWLAWLVMLFAYKFAFICLSLSFLPTIHGEKIAVGLSLSPFLSCLFLCCGSWLGCSCFGTRKWPDTVLSSRHKHKKA